MDSEVYPTWILIVLFPDVVLVLLPKENNGPIVLSRKTIKTQVTQALETNITKNDLQLNWGRSIDGETGV